MNIKINAQNLEVRARPVKIIRVKRIIMCLSKTFIGGGMTVRTLPRQNTRRGTHDTGGMSRMKELRSKNPNVFI